MNGELIMIEFMEVTGSVLAFIEIVLYISVIPILIVISFRLKRKLKKSDRLIQDLRMELNRKYKVISIYENQKMDRANKRNWYEENNLQIERDLLNNPEKFYYGKSSCMNKNESRIFYYINWALTVLQVTFDFKIEDYYVFPQTSLHSFIGIQTGVNGDSGDIPRRKLVGKNVDFIICYCHKEGFYYSYKPILMIEVDGSSHFSSKTYGYESFENQQKSDMFKNSVSKSLGIPLLRYKIENDSVTKQDRFGVQKALTEFFQDKNENREQQLYYYNKRGNMKYVEYMAANNQ